MQLNSVSSNKYPNFSNTYNAPSYGASDPFVTYTATQPVLFYRSFFSNLSKDDVARTGVLPDVSLAAINNMANWSTVPPKEDFDSYQRLLILAGGENPGLISQDVERYAQERAIMGQGVAPYTVLNKVILENMTPEQIRELAEQKGTVEELAKYDPKALIDPETGERYYVDMQGRKVPALKIGDEVISQKALEPLSKTMLERGLLYRLYGSLKAGGLLPNTLAAGAVELNESLNPLTQNQLTSPAYVGASRTFGVEPLFSIQEQINEQLGDISIAQYKNKYNPFDSNGIADDIMRALEPTEEEKASFNGIDWFRKSINPEVIPFLSQKGIDENLVRYARGHREALYFIQKELSTSTIQERVERYAKDAGFFKSNAVTSIVTGFPTMVINDPDAALGAEIAIGTALTGSVVGAGLGALSSIKRGADLVKRFNKLSKISAIKRTQSTVRGLYQISMGDLPNWIRTSSTVKQMALGAGIGAFQNAGATLRGQLNKISWANTALLTDTSDEISWSDAGWAGIFGAGFGGLIGGIAGIGNRKYRLDNSRFIDDDGNEKTMVGSTVDQQQPITEGLAAAKEEMAVNPENNPPDILEQNNKNIKDSGIDVVSPTGKKVRLNEEDIFNINEVDPEKVMSGEYTQVRDSRTNQDVLVRKDVFDAIDESVQRRITEEEPKLSNLERSTVDTERFADAADISTKAKIDDGLAKTSESTALNRTASESDSEYALRAINAGEVNSSADVLRLLSEPETKSKNVLKRLVDFKRKINSAKNLLNTVQHNKGTEWTKARLDELEKLETTELKEAINKAMNAGDNAFTKLPEDIKTKMINFVNKHAGKSDDEIDQLLYASKDLFNRSQRDMLKRRLKTPVTRTARRKLIEEVLSDNSISDKSRKILNTLLGTPENLSLNERKRASGAYRKEKYFFNKASYLTGEFYIDFKNIINEALDIIPTINTKVAKENSELILGLVRGALVNLRLPERAGTNRITIKLDNLKENVLGSNKLTFDKNGVGLLEITLDKNTLVKALETGDKALIAHTVLHELGHAYSYFATPTEIIRMMTMYSEFLDLDVLEAFVNITESTRGSLADSVGVYAAINPGEVFANHFANQGLVTSLDAAAKLKLSFLEAFTTYVEDIINGIADVFTFNDTTKLKLKRISKVLNEVIENISTTKPDATTLIDMVKEERDFSIALKKASFYDKDKKKYQKNIIKLIKDNLPKKITGEDGRLLIDFLTDGYAERKDFSIDKDFLFDIRLIAPEISSIKTTSRDLFSALQAIKKEMGMENFYLNSIVDEFDLLLNPEKIFSYQLFRDLPTISKLDSFNTIRNIVKTAELTSTRVALERYLKNNKLETLPTIESALNFIKTQGDYISAGLTRYLNDRVFGLSRINENIQMLETLNSKAKTKSILRQNVFKLPNGQQIFRPKFDTGLDDTSLVLYHGGTWTGNKEPNMLHSGTLKAAFDRTKHLLDSNNKYNIVAFEVSKEANIIEMVDTGINHTDFESYWKAITEAYDNKPDLRFVDIIRDIIVDKKKADEIITKLSKISEEYNNIITSGKMFIDTEGKFTPDIIKKILKEAGVDVIKYKNVGEDIGSTSFVIVNPRVISIKANGKFEPDGTWAWRSTYTGMVLESTTRDLHDINYRGSESLEKLISLLPDLKGITADLSEAIGIQKEVEFKPTAITEVTPETKPLLQQELDALIVKIEGLNPSFFRRLAAVVRATTSVSINWEDAKSVLTEVWIKGREQLEKNEIPDILKLKTEKSIFASVVSYKKFGSLKELEARAKGGKVGELDAFEDVEVAAGQANKNNETIDDEAMDIDSRRKRQSDFKTWLNSLNTVSEENKQAIDALFDIRVQYFKGTKTKTLQDIKPGEVPKLPAGSGEKLYFAMNPEQKTEYDAAVAKNNQPLLNDSIKKEFDLATTIKEKIEVLKKANVLKNFKHNRPFFLYEGRLMVMANVDGIDIPFYLSSGENIKIGVESGKWYPVFGLSENGWIIKSTSISGGMNKAYGVKKLQQIKQLLDSNLGNLEQTRIKRREGKVGKIGELEDTNFENETGYSFTKDGIKSTTDLNIPELLVKNIISQKEVDDYINSVISKINESETVITGYKKKFTNLVTKIQKLEKKLLDEYRATPDKPIHAEKVLHDSVLEKVAKSDEPVLKTEQTKQENLEKDSILEEENQATLVTKEEVPEVAAPILKGKGGDEMFTTTSVLDDPRTMQLGHMFTTERRAAGVRKKLNRRFTVRARINKSRVLRIVNDGKSVFESIKALPEPILRSAGINKSIMERVLGSVVKEHSESEAIRVILHKLNEEGYTAIELVDQRGNLIGDMPTSLDHVELLSHVDHEEITGPKYVPTLRTEPVKPVPAPTPKNTIEVEPDPVINPEELPVKTKDGEPLEKTQEKEVGPSDVPKISEEESFIHSTLNATESLRWNGTTPKIVKIALLRFMKRAKELRENLGQPLTGVPVEFRNLLYKVLRAAESIAEENRTKFGDLYEDINNEFWTIFDREIAKELVARGEKGIELSIRTINEIIDYSHQKLNDNIKLRNQRDGLNLPEFTKPLKADDFDFTSSSATNKYPDTVVFKKGSIAEKMNSLSEKKIKEAMKPVKKVSVEKEATRQEVRETILNSIENTPVDNTMLLRESNFVGRIFGGSQRENRNWFRSLMNGAANIIAGNTGVNVTTRSLSNIVRSLAAWADNSKAHIHHLVGGGKNAFKSWEAISHEVYRLTKEIEKAQYDLIKSAPNEKIVGTIFVEVMKLFGSKKPLDKVLIQNILSSVIKNPDKLLIDSVYSKTQNLYNSVVSLNKKILDLENETGWIELKDKDGNPIKPEEYFPITFIGERILPSNRDNIIKELVRVRRESLIKSDNLSTDIMLSMGWLFDNSDDLSAGILDKGREVEGRKTHFLSEANFDRQTLINLEVNRYKAGSDTKTFAELAGEASNKHFVYIDSRTNELVVCKIPRKKTDLSLSDLAKYNEVLNGSTNYLGKQWKANFPGMPVSPLYTIMSEYLDSKIYQGRYNKESAFRKGNPMNPMLQLRDRNRIEYGISVKALTWDELLSSEVLLGITRSDPLEAYSNFVKARGFDLLLQKELDRKLGSKGIRFTEYLTVLLQEAKENARALGANDNQILDIEAGFARLAQEVLAYKGMLSSIDSVYRKDLKEGVEIGLSLVRGASGTMWGITGSAEPTQHLILSPFTVGPIQAAKNLLETVRIIIGDKRFSVSRAMQDELVDSIFFMDFIRGDLADRVINLDTDGTPKITKWFDRISATREDSRFGLVSDLSDWFGNVGVEIGSSRYTTFLARKFAMQRFGKKIAKFINSGAAERFFNELNSPEVQARMSKFAELAATDVKAEQELFKIFKELARKNGFGGDWEYALSMNKFGLNTVEKIRALRVAFNYLGKQYSKNGLINWRELKELFHENIKQRILEGIDAKDGMDAFESFMFTAETMTTTNGAISTTRGLNKDLSIESRTPTGRLTRSLLGWSQSFYDNVIGSYGSMSESGYLGMLILYTALTAASEYLKEWIQGRDILDIKTEFKKDPQTFLFRMMMAAPVLGRFNGVINTGLSELSEITGGPLKSFTTPLGAPGYNIAVSAPYKMAKGFANLVLDAIPSGDPAKIAKDTSAALGVTSFFNNSPLVIPARILVETGVINQTDAMGRYMELIKKRKNSYSKAMTAKVGTKSYGMDMQRKEELLRESLRKTETFNKNKGVSSDLANLLKDMSNKQ